MLIADFQVAKDADWDDSFYVVDAAGQPVSIEDADLELTVRYDDPAEPQAELLLFASNGNGLIVKDPDQPNVFSIVVPHAVVEEIPTGRHYHVLHIVRPGSRKRMWSGSVEFTEPFA